MRDLGFDPRGDLVGIAAQQIARGRERAGRQRGDLCAACSAACSSAPASTTVLTMPASLASAAVSGRPIANSENARA